MLHRTILVAFGANLPGPGGMAPRDTCAAALARLGATPGLRLVAASSMYGSRPVPPSGQPDFVNGAALLQGDVAPHALLALLHGAEADGGRRRGVANAARTLDLDLLAVDEVVLGGPELVLPHPRLHLRRFVLMPLADVAPGWRHPLLGRTVAEMLSAVPDDGGCWRED